MADAATVPEYDTGDLDDSDGSAMELVAQIVEANAKALYSTLDAIRINDRMDTYRLEDVEEALSSIPWGLTTAEYEAGLARVRRAARGSFSRNQEHRERAKAYVECDYDRERDLRTPFLGMEYHDA